MLISLAVIALLLAALLIYAMTRPETFRLERSIAINAPAAKIYPLISNFHGWRAWSPWENLDPDLKRTYTGDTVYEWEGRKAGKGRMEITHASPDWHILIKLDFIKPFEGHNTAEFTLTPTGNVTNVNWAMYGPNTFISKLMPMDKIIGGQFEQGLASMKKAAER